MKCYLPFSTFLAGCTLLCLWSTTHAFSILLFHALAMNLCQGVKKEQTRNSQCHKKNILYQNTKKEEQFQFLCQVGWMEWLKVCISNNFLNLNWKALWKWVFTNYKDRFCNILMLVEILPILPLLTSYCEHWFSIMSTIKPG